MKRPFVLYVICAAAILLVVLQFFGLGQRSSALDVASGDGVMLYGESGNTTPRWRTYQTANSFGGENATVAGSTPVNTIVKTSPTKQEAIAGYVNASGTLQIMCYNGTSWTNEWSVSVGGTGTTGRFDIAYETTTGDVMVVYSTNAPSTDELAYRTKVGANGCGVASWSSATNINAVRTSGTVLWVRLEASIVASSNTIGLAWSDDANDLSAMEWTGSSWAVAEPTSALESDLERVSAAGDVLAFDIAFESLTGNMVIAWGPSDAAIACTIGTNCMKYSRYTTSWLAATAVPTVADEATNIDISANPDSNQIILAAIGNRQADLSLAYWSGSAWTGVANRDTDCTTPIAGTKMTATGWLIAGATTRNIVVYADATATATSISYQTGNNATFSVGTDFAGAPVPGAFRWFDVQTDPINKDRLMLSYSDANGDLFAKRLVMTSTPGFTWTNSDGSAALEASLTQATMYPFSFAYWRFIPPPTPSQGDGQIIYGEGTVATPRDRLFYDGIGQWAAETSLPTNTSTTYATAIKSAPTRDEKLAVVTNSSGVVNVYRWNGTTWSSEWTVTTGFTLTPRVAITYEESSGDAMVVYSTNAAPTNEMAYRVWNGSSWTSPTSIDAQRTSGVADYLVAKTRTGTNEIGLAWADANRDLSAMYWDGSSWTSEPTSTPENDIGQIDGVSPIEGPVLDVAFENQSGELLLVWANNANANLKYITRGAGSGGSWGSVVTPASFTQQAEIVRLESRPGTNEIAYINNSNWTYPASTTSEKVEAAVWSGSAWTVSGTYDSNIAHRGEYDVGVIWLTSGGTTKALFTYDKAASTGIDYFTYDPGTGTFSASATDSVAPAPVNSDDQLHRLVRNPYDATEAMLIVVDDNNALYSKKASFNGTSVTWSSLDPGGAVMESSVSTGTTIYGWEADYDYRRFFSAGGALTADIVDGAGSTVASPSLSMAATAVSSDCQATTGTFGVSSQKARITNTTATPGWTLAMAATAGSTASWSSGTANYDFNDSSGTPTGCSDGADADSLAGQLSVDPSAITISPEAGCSATGITGGSSSAFAQGTVDSITLTTASGSTQTNCYWDVTGISLSQQIPGFQPAGSYSVNMTITATAN